jgi:hypothetical protein
MADNEQDIIKKFKISKHHIQPWQAKAQEHIIRKRIKELGANSYNMMLPETRVLPFVLHPEEKINGIVYGRYSQDAISGEKIIGRGTLVATTKRVLLIDRKPLFSKNNEISYGVISGISSSEVALVINMTLYTRVGNINLRTYNPKCAHKFVEAIEDKVFSTEQRKQTDD